MSLSAALSIAAACAQGQDRAGDADAGPGSDGGAGTGRDARATGSNDDGGTGTPDDDSGTSAGCTGKLVINELQSGGPNGAEFVELFNPTPCAVDLTNWKIPYRASSGNAGLAIHAFEEGESLAAGAYLLLANDKLDAGNPTIARFNGGGSLGNDGGQIALTDADGKVIDAVGYGSGTSGMYTEKSPAPAPTGSASIGRDSKGTDTDDNSADFKTLATPSPGVAN